MKPGASDERNIDAAMNRVLTAERTARDAVDACRAEADRLLAAAETEAAAIAERAERRIRAAHRIADRGIERAVAELRPAAPAAAAEAPEEMRIAALAEQLAAELTGRPQ